MTIQIWEPIDWLIRGDIILIFRRMPTICSFFFFILGQIYSSQQDSSPWQPMVTLASILSKKGIS